MNTTKVSDYWEFDAANKINLYVPPFLVIIGGIGNLVSFFVYLQKKYRSKVAPVYILSLSVIDTVNLFLGLLQYWILFNFYQSSITKTHCNFMFFVVNFVGNYAHWCVVAFTIDRFLAVCFPFWTKTHQTVNRAWLAVAAIGLIAALKNIHYIWTSDFVYDSKTNIAACGFGLLDKDKWILHYQIFEIVISSIFPFVIIIILNTAIVIKMHRDGNFSKQYRNTSRIKTNSSENRDSDIEIPKRYLFDYGLTISLLLVSTVFIVLITPLLILRLHHASKHTSMSAHEKATYEMRYQLFHKLWYANNAVNFFLYSLSGRTFRKDLIVLFSSCYQGTKRIFM